MEKLVLEILKIKKSDFKKEKDFCRDFIKLERIQNEIILLEHLLMADGYKHKNGEWKK